MKKLFLFVIVGMFSFVALNAQEELNFGLKAGVNFAKLTGDDVEDADGRTGFHVGLIAEIFMGEKFAIQPELVYSQQGLQTKEEFLGEEFETKSKLDYLNIPVMGKYYVGEDLAIEFGPQFGFNVSAKSEFEGGGESDEEDIKDEIAGFDLGVGGGLSFNMETGWFAQARYIIGLSNVDDSDEGGIEDDLTNSVLSLSIGYKF